MSRLSSKDRLIILLSVVFLLFLFAGTYFLFVQPQKTELANKERQLQTEEQLLTVLQNKITETNESTFESTMELQKRVPVKLLTEKLLLDIEKAEVISDSFIVSMDFGDGEIMELSEESNQTELEIELDNKESEEEKLKDSIPLPTGVKKVSVNLSIESPSYFELEKFIEAIERSDRIIVVEKIDFSGKEEITTLDQSDEPLKYAMTISAFYMPMLTDLISELPQIEAPKPSNKKNPFISFSELSNDEDD